MKTASQEREDELKYLDMEDADTQRIYYAAPSAAMSWGDRIGIALIIAGALVIALAIILGLREEFRIIGRIFH
jgi:hypothetical protein